MNCEYWVLQVAHDLWLVADHISGGGAGPSLLTGQEVASQQYTLVKSSSDEDESEGGVDDNVA
jgi:hypothetical protein